MHMHSSYTSDKSSFPLQSPQNAVDLYFGPTKTAFRKKTAKKKGTTGWSCLEKIVLVHRGLGDGGHVSAHQVLCVNATSRNMSSNRKEPPFSVAITLQKKARDPGVPVSGQGGVCCLCMTLTLETMRPRTPWLVTQPLSGVGMFRRGLFTHRGGRFALGLPTTWRGISHAVIITCHISHIITRTQIILNTPSLGLDAVPSGLPRTVD